MINKFGLYENVVPRRMMCGLKSNYLDNQTQGWWLPFFKDGEIYLVDTYHIDHSTRKNLDKFIEDNENNVDNSWLINRADSDYYYGGSVKITSATEGYFKEVCDLRYFEITKDDPNDYEKEDIVRHVQLWFEHGYPHGVTLKRKGAKKSANKQALNKMNKVIDNVHTSWIYSSDVEELKSYLNNEKVEEKTKLELEVTLKYIDKAMECNELLHKASFDYRKELNKIREQFGEQKYDL